MITKFKIFEKDEYGLRLYWKIPIDEYYFGYLRKLEIPKETQIHMRNHYLDLCTSPDFISRKYKYFWVACEVLSDGTYDWTWNYDEKSGNKDFEYQYQPGGPYKRQPDIVLTKEEKEEEKLRLDTEKYNL